MDIKNQDFEKLRKQAEELLPESDEPDEEIKRLIYENKVYQTELELQNEELRNSQQSLQASRDRYYDLYDLAPVGYFTVNQKGLITEVNLTACSMLGRSRHMLKNRMAFIRLIEEENVDEYLQFKERVSRTRQSATVELSLKRKSPGALHVQLSGSFVQDQDNPEGLIRIAIIDITAQKSAETAYKASERKFQILAESAANLIGIIQEEKLVYVNPYVKKIFGYTPQEIKKLDVKELIHPDFQTFLVNELQKNLKGDEANRRYEFKVITKNKEIRWLDMAVARVEYENKPAIIISAVDVTERHRVEEDLKHARDEMEHRVEERTRELARANENLQDEILERKQMEVVLKDYTEKLEQINQELKDFAFMASHDLREPLRKISHFAEIINRKYSSGMDDVVLDYFRRMKKAALQMRHLIDDLLKYSQASRSELVFTEVDLNEVVRLALDDLEYMIERENATVVCDPLISVRGDLRQLQQLF
ncbi:MAG: PAS domain S-box protein, partial [Calditrichia bacterium]